MSAWTWPVIVASLWCWCLVYAQEHPLLVCPPEAGTRCVLIHDAHNSFVQRHEFNITIDGKFVSIGFLFGYNDDVFEMECWEHHVLDTAAMPRFEPELIAKAMSISNCAITAHSFADILNAFNVVVSPKSIELRGVIGNLTRNHLIGLESLQLFNCLNCKELHIEPDTFTTAPDLWRLRLEDVTAMSIDHLPDSLEELFLDHTDITNISRTALKKLSRLTELSVRNFYRNISVEAGGFRLKKLVLEASHVQLDTFIPDALDSILITNWGEVSPKPLEGCAALETLTIEGAAVVTLPNLWLVRCRKLRSLKIDRAPGLVTLPPNALRGVVSFRKVSLTNCALDKLPKAMLEDSNWLELLNFTGNHLVQVPSDLFNITSHVTVLDLSNNEFTIDVFKPMMNLNSLKELYLADNVQLGDVCDENNKTNEKLVAVLGSTLSKLSLRNTSATIVCPDWWQIYMPEMTHIDLSDNLINSLSFLNLKFSGKNYITVDLTGNNVTDLAYNHGDYKRLLNNSEALCESGGRPRSVVLLSSELYCDCNAQWTARALQQCSPREHILDARCTSGTPFRDMQLNEFVCPVSPEECPVAEPCRCDMYERLEEPIRVMRVTCEHANLTRVPILPAKPDMVWELRLAHNRIAAVGLADLPPNLLGIDLRHNNISRLDLDMMTSMLTDGRNVQLSGNPLICDCAAASAIRLLLTNQARVEDFNKVTCRGGAPLIPPDDCESSDIIAPLLGGLIPLLLMVAVLVACLARPLWRAQVMAVLRGLGWLPRPAELPDDRPYDAFISFSHHDEVIVEEMIQRLESGARPYLVCVHSRDWVPGGWIPELIAASVRHSRRTIALVTKHFLKSTWARAEFREAHAEAIRSAEPRLVVVLLADPDTLDLDDELRCYLAANTYLKWGDPWFWQKLRAALPAPRPPVRETPAELALRLPPTFYPAPLLRQQIHALEIEDDKAAIKY